MTTLRASEKRIPKRAYDRVIRKGERVRVSRRGGPSVYIISEDDLKLLEEMEDRVDAVEAMKELRAFHKSGKKAIPLEEVYKEAKSATPWRMRLNLRRAPNASTSNYLPTSKIRFIKRSGRYRPTLALLAP